MTGLGLATSSDSPTAEAVPCVYCGAPIDSADRAALTRTSLRSERPWAQRW